MSEGPVAPGSATETPQPDESGVATGSGRGAIEPVAPSGGDDFLAPADGGMSQGE